MTLFDWSTDQVWVSSIFVGVIPLLEVKILAIHIFRTFLLHTLAYWAEILHMTLFYCTSDQVWVSSICVNFCRSYSPFGTLNTGNTQFSAFFSSCVQVFSWNFTYDFVLLCYRWRLSVISWRQVLKELCPFWNWEYWKYTVFRTFLLRVMTYWAEISHMTFLMYYRSTSGLITLYPSGS